MMELYWKFLLKFYGYIEFKVILFDLLLFLPVLNGVDPKCNYSGNLKVGEKCYVQNPEFPNYYKNKSENHYVWKLTSENVIKINCSLQIGNNCNQDRLSVKFSEANNEFYYCGFVTFVHEGKNPIIRLDSLLESQGGRFICEVQAEIQALEDNSNKCDCGRKKVTRIVGGKETGINEYPMMCGIITLVDKYIHCGCTIISNHHVLTAGHCIIEKKRRKLSDIGVIVGEHDVRTDKDTNATKVFTFMECVIHPEYNATSEYIYNNIAVCKIRGDIEYSAEIGPVCLPFQHKNDLFDGINGTALGWGLLEYEGEKSKVLQEVNLKIISFKKCVIKDYNVSYRDICTYTPDKDTCQLDDGGPLLWQNPSTKKLVLIGVTSVRFRCAENEDVLSTRVGAYLDWILSVTPGVRYCDIE